MGSSRADERTREQPESPVEVQRAALSTEDEDFRKFKRRIDALAANAGLTDRVRVTVRRRGLMMQLLTDKVFFDSGEATIKPGARVLLDKIAGTPRVIECGKAATTKMLITG